VYSLQYRDHVIVVQRSQPNDIVRIGYVVMLECWVDMDQLSC
jgi:hypothetical protein